MKTDLEIAQTADIKPITSIASKIGIEEKALILYGRHKAKIDPKALTCTADGKLILVTAINPTPAGEGKTTVSIGLADALNSQDYNTVLALREPSLGPVFGIKGGAAGGGYSQVVPMEDINLHFTGDLHAVTAANNLLCAMVDNHIHQGNDLNINPKTITVRRCMDMNDRQLRNIICGLGKPTDGVTREDGFDITAASEIMAVLCLADDISDLKNRLNKITVGYNYQGIPVYARDIGAGGAMAALLKDAVKPNLVQTLEHTPVLVHGGPFANIAHGCNSVAATKTALCLSDYVVTEAGFGADLGAEKFLDIKCRYANIWPDAIVIVATIRALKYHGGINKEDLNKPNIEALDAGFSNLEKHLNNLKDIYGFNAVVAINKFNTDTDDEISHLEEKLKDNGFKYAVTTSWEYGSKGAVDLANKVVDAINSNEIKPPSHPYDYADPIKNKILKLAQKVYGAGSVEYHSGVTKKITDLEEQGYGNLPVCIAKTQYSLSDDASKHGAPKGFKLEVRDVKLSSGAGFIVVICGDIMRMPGLPKNPAAININLDDKGNIQGIF